MMSRSNGSRFFLFISFFRISTGRKQQRRREAIVSSGELAFSLYSRRVDVTVFLVGDAGFVAENIVFFLRISLENAVIIVDIQFSFNVVEG
ncbi:hypothetical protein CDAR_236941 [Caerostris darwini]|uniref:Secreted protein n=1 Tax=Caerostris darwini TaxID=1538125 RepID=A0AAV4W052_9ARAC|nr:hypothetical protein CDAR_236941 [Caerostris darwini]